MRAHAAVGALVLVLSQGCALKTLALKSVADTLSTSGETFASDDDPELVRDAVPFALKTYESLLESLPRHRGLLLATCSGFTQYSYAFVEPEAEALEAREYERSLAVRERSLKLYLRARDYCLRAIEVAHPGLPARLNAGPDPGAALLAVKKKGDVPLLYWTGAAWGAAVSLGLDRPALVGDMPIVRALMDRALALDPTFGQGAIHEVLISLEALPAEMGGSVERARAHFERAVELQRGRGAGAYVTLATAVALPAHDRAEFVRLLERALAVDVDADKSRRLANLIAQKRARDLLSRVDDLFVTSEDRLP
ncbi:MAG TPA: TRAP transporter TatT component family protein [Vicinamibacterales bacterium]|nr:TRAP transporter TatT component family protein [Vicinamibacterales bacterium]